MHTKGERSSSTRRSRKLVRGISMLGFSAIKCIRRTALRGSDPRRQAAPRTVQETILMRIGLFYQIQVPKPWTPSSESQRIHEALDQIPYAEQHGFHSVGCSRHN